MIGAVAEALANLARLPAVVMQVAAFAGACLLLVLVGNVARILVERWLAERGTFADRYRAAVAEHLAAVAAGREKPHNVLLTMPSPADRVAARLGMPMPEYREARRSRGPGGRAGARQ